PVKLGGYRRPLQYAPRPSVCGTAGREGAHDGFDNRLTSRSLAWQGRGWHRSRIALATAISGADRGGRDDDVDAPRRTSPGRPRGAGSRFAHGVPPRRGRAAGSTRGGGRTAGDRPVGNPTGGQRGSGRADADSAQGGGTPPGGVPAGSERGAALSPCAHQTGRLVRAGERRGLRAAAVDGEGRPHILPHHAGPLLPGAAQGVVRRGRGGAAADVRSVLRRAVR